MKKEMRIGVTFLASFALAAALWAFSPASSTAQTPQTPPSQSSAAAQSVSGKVTSVEKTSFTLSVGADHASNVSQSEAQTPSSPSTSTAKSMTFQIDQNTTVDGKLKVGANADVTYRQEGSNNIAISVRVS
jgi:hypothetical protein